MCGVIYDIIFSAIRGEIERIELPEIGQCCGEHAVILCPVCNNKALDNHAICAFCGWEHDGFPEDHYSAANRATLSDYRREYSRLLGEEFRNV